MTFNEFELKLGNNFIAMEYYGLMLNRTFIVLLLEDHLLGLKVNGLISVAGGADPVTQSITRNMAIKSDLDNPYAYADYKRVEALGPLDLLSDEITSIDKANFRISYASLKRISYDPKKKWGMGHYPHDGKVKLQTVANHKKEFIILGAQSGSDIADWLKSKC